MTEYCWLNATLVPITEARVSVLDHGLLYGDGVFEGIRVYHQQAFMLKEHLDRLWQSAQALAIHIPYSKSELADACTLLIQRNGLKDGYIRLVVTRGEGTLGLDPRNCHSPSVFILYRGLKMADESIQLKGARLITASVRRTPTDVLEPKIKTLNYLNNILAKMEANVAGMDDAIMLNDLGHVAEASAANIFIIKEGQLATPPIDAGILQGITRDCVLQLAEESGLVVFEKPLTRYDIYNADECFLTGSGAELIPVGELDGRKIKSCPGVIFKQLKQAFRALTLKESLSVE